MTHDGRMVDLSPDPRVLRMLGEINFETWQCVAELIDNSVDAYLGSDHDGSSSTSATVRISLPESAERDARVLVRDTGPGMSVEDLSRAVRAGWSGNDPLNNLGLFGMGFNIATARLGSVTEVFTSRADDPEETGLRIDLNALHRQGDFSTELLSRPKAHASSSGTSVSITNLKPEYLSWFARAANRAAMVDRLGRVYSSMLRANGRPLHLHIDVNGNACRAHEHCVWSEQRGAEHARMGRIPAQAQIDQSFGERPFCTACWRWLPSTASTCDVCRSSVSVATRPRRLTGWIGIQRYPHASEYGIDFIRNGRKIETGNKDLFHWQPSEGGSAEREYPIDDPRQGGRIVGEVHLDHCRVAYTKDRFERNDPAWEDMVRAVRGEGPLRPKSARDAGFGENNSPLYRLYQAFRRTDPHGGRYADICSIHMKKHRPAVERLKAKFHDGSDVTDDDSAWWTLVQASDAPSSSDTPVGPSGPVDPPGPEIGFGTGTRDTDFPPTTEDTSATATTEPPIPTPRRVRSAELSGTYDMPAGHASVAVEAFEATDTDPVFGGKDVPWASIRSGTGAVTFYFRPGHDVFQSSTLTPLDALLCEVARRVADTISSRHGARGANMGPGAMSSPDPLQAAFATVLSHLRLRYGSSSDLRQTALRDRVNEVFRRALLRAGSKLSEREQRGLHSSLKAEERNDFQRECYKLEVDPDDFPYGDGRFFTCVSARTFVRFVHDSPELFLKGQVWSTPYADWADRNEAVDRHRRAVLESHHALLLDLLAFHEDLGSASALVSEDMFPRTRRLRVATAVDALLERLNDGGD